MAPDNRLGERRSAGQEGRASGSSHSSSTTSPGESVEMRISTESVEMRLIVLERLNNILASSERQKAMELIMTNLGTLLGDIAPDSAADKIIAVILETLANLRSFVHMHATLLEYGVLNMIGKIRLLAISVEDMNLVKLRHKMCKILSCFLHARDIFHSLLDFTYVEFIAENLGLDEPLCLHTVLRQRQP